jgi:hypothetical protein
MPEAAHGRAVIERPTGHHQAAVLGKLAGGTASSMTFKDRTGGAVISSPPRARIW